ncbi:hypothetical protein SAMN04488100_13130 [Alkalibacterium putridalgicola]|uniref:Uncharacterized protein n=1 Tax=Alkalibacterium putridalgicola TaxID=426703 RepID=A0A1H7W7D4_9LACT|nr:hypothetical protein [Alkalibacterium putridalgicola]GEK89987.1 hypothetical protein APU01nite_20260 [Alkalibacterium putridalgicola]SEM17512.1 hypothetical protein SAMN04488100_13130 [Alkalibacterium putridalgicola]
MRTYRAIQLLNDLSESELDNLASFFSNKETVIRENKNPFVCVAFNPDQYFQNETKISQAFSNNKFLPLVVSNYKFLALLLAISSQQEYSFTDFSFKENEEESYFEKDKVKDMLDDYEDVKNISNFLKESSQKIQYIELVISHPKNRIRVHSSGSISLTNSFDKNLYPDVIKLVQFLFTGSMSKT